jgi:hypothetical protein
LSFAALDDDDGNGIAKAREPLRLSAVMLAFPGSANAVS